jgi:hypothetical protein
MKKVNVRQLRSEISNLIKELPFEIVNGNTMEVLARVVSPDQDELSKLREQIEANKEYIAYLEKERVEESEVKEVASEAVSDTIIGKCEKPFCKFEGEVKYGKALGEWNDQLGEREIIKGYFCKKHLV